MDKFWEWKKKWELLDTYTYGDGNGDKITTKYTADNVTLPTPTKKQVIHLTDGTTQSGKKK